MLPLGYLHRPTPLALAMTTITAVTAMTVGMLPAMALAQTSDAIENQLPSTTVDTIVVTASHYRQKLERWLQRPAY